MLAARVETLLHQCHDKMRGFLEGKMFVSKRSVDSKFKDVPEGRVFYGGGWRSNGYIVTNDVEISLRKTIPIWPWISLMIILVVSFLPPMIGVPRMIAIVVPMSAIASFIYWRIIKRQLAGCPKLITRLTWAEMVRLRANSYSSTQIGILILLALFMTVLSAGAFVNDLRQKACDIDIVLFSGAGIMFFGFCLLVFVQMALAGTNDD